MTEPITPPNSDAMLPLIRLFEGDSLDVLATIADGTYTGFVTDPPYGLSAAPDPVDVLTQWLLQGDFVRGKGGRTKAPPPGLSEIAARFARTAGPGGFLGAKWDSFVPGPRLWREVFRTCKPGAIGLVFASPRTQHWMALALVLAGFEVIDTIGHIQSQGMAKSGSIDKRIDARRDDRERLLACTRWVRERCAALGLKAADLDRACGTNGMGGHWTSAASQPHVPTREQWARLEPLLGVMPDTLTAMRQTIDAREPGEDWAKREVVVVRDMGETSIWGNGSGTHVESLPGTETSADWQGYSTQLAPGIEPIIVVRRPCEGTAVQNVLTHGCGAMNIDACRIPREEGVQDSWPKNAMFDAAAAAILDDMIGDRTSGSRRAGARKGMGYHGADGDGGPEIKASRGGPSRFFWVGPLATEDDTASPARYVPKVRTSERNAGLPEGVKCTHPTMKPGALMEWLCRLVGHPAGRGLDPFAGSGSTLRAARNLGLTFDGIERDPKFAEVARWRSGVNAQNAPATPSEVAPPCEDPPTPAEPTTGPQGAREVATLPTASDSDPWDALPPMMPTGVWYFPTRYGQRAADSLAHRLNVEVA